MSHVGLVSMRAVERSADRVSGNWVSRDTRVPVNALFENLESGRLHPRAGGARSHDVTTVYISFKAFTADSFHSVTFYLPYP